MTIVMRFMISFCFYLAGSFFIGAMSSQIVHAETISLRDKIGQMFVIGFDGVDINQNSSIVHDIQEYNLGGVILFDYNNQTKNFGKNIVSRAQVATLNASLQEFNRVAQKDRGRPALPLLISVDYEGGRVNRLKSSYGFPETLSATAIAQLPFSEAQGYADTMAKTLSETGFNLNFAPVLDVNVNPDNPILGKSERTYSESPFVVAQYAGIFSQAYLNQGVQCAFKHFPGHGSSTTDSHLGFVDVSSSWQTYELDPYLQLLHQPQSCGVVMTAHIVNRQLDDSGLPATLSRKILKDLLRDTLHFDGVVISDDMQMKAISAHYTTEQALALAINAGVDMLIFGAQLDDALSLKALIDAVEHQVQIGQIPVERIDEAYQRIVRLKAFFSASQK
jgi:beta-N-acetylhexosaminidase